MRTQPKTRARSAQEAGNRALNLGVSKANQACKHTTPISRLPLRRRRAAQQVEAAAWRRARVTSRAAARRVSPRARRKRRGSGRASAASSCEPPCSAAADWRSTESRAPAGRAVQRPRQARASTGRHRPPNLPARLVRSRTRSPGPLAAPRQRVHAAPRAAVASR